MTDSSQTRIAYVPEVTYGVTPATPVFKKFRTTSVPSLSPDVQYLSSDEIRDDRNVSAAAASGISAAFELPIELSYGSFDDMLESLLGGTFTADVLKNGVLKKSFTFENTFQTEAGARYQRIPGAVVNTMQLAVQANGKVEGSFGLMGQNALSASTAIAGSTYTAAGTSEFYQATNDLTIALDGGSLAVSVMGVSLAVTNNDRLRPVIGSQLTAGIGVGRFEVSGQLNAYFNDSLLYDQFLADTYTDLTLDFNDPVFGRITILLPRIKFTAGKINSGGNNTDVMAEMSFMAVFDTTEGCTMKITRDPV